MKRNYKKDTKKACLLLPELEGAKILSILINVVYPEFNVVYLNTDKGVYSLHGKAGGEFLGVHRIEKLPELSRDENRIICQYPPFSEFEGHTISQARQIGSVWHGHGFEFSFSGLLTKSMIVQSIYCGVKPEGTEDCLRLGIGNYEIEWKET